MRFIRASRLILPAVFLLLSCSDPSEPAKKPTSITVVSGSGQSGPVATVLPQPIVVEVKDASGKTLRGVTVTWTVTSGGGSVSAATMATDASGRAQVQWTLGAGVGENRLSAGVTGVAAAVATATGGVDQVTDLQNDVAVPGIAAAQGSSRFYRISVPTGALRLTVNLSGGSGDVDLFVRRGVIPTTDISDCQSTSPSATELCVVNAPAAGDWYVLLDAYSAYSNVTLRAVYALGGNLAVNVTGLPPGAVAAIAVSSAAYYNQAVTATQTLSLLPGSYTITSQNVLHAGTVYTPALSTQQVAVTGGNTTSATVTYAASAGGLNLDITGAYITQGVQRTNGSVPLVAGRDGLLRVFARASAANAETPSVRVRAYRNNALVDERTIAAPAGSVPVANDEGVLTSTWNVLLSGSLIQPGTSLLVDIDPENAVAETVEADNTFPASGTPFMLDVRTATTMQARLVPVRQSVNDSLGDVTTANAESYTTLAHALYPLPGMDVDVRATYTFTGELPSQYDSEWGRLLGELLTLRTADASTRYYYGVVKPAYANGGTGLGYIGAPAALGVDWPNWRSETLAHEWGHNFGRKHVACGNPANPDPQYPYTDRPGGLGYHGYDMRTNTIRSKDAHHDLMSYCQPTWASDYTYEAVLAFRGSQAGPSAAVQPSLLVWGRISPEGVVLEPAFEVVTRPVLPSRRGPYRVTGKDAKGATVLDISFDGHAVDHMPGVRHFAFAIPLSSLRGGRPTELRLTGDAGEAVRRQAPPGVAAGAGDEMRVSRGDRPGRVRLQWNAALNPVVMVRDLHTGAVLSFARGGDVHVATDAAEVEVNMSDGVRSTARRIVVSR